MAKKVNILIYEPEIISRHMLKSILDNDYAVNEADTIANVKNTIEQCMPDIVIMDISDDYEDSLALIEYVKTINSLKKTVLIAVITAHDKDKTYEMVKAGINYIITKPYDPTIIKHTIASIRDTYIIEKEALEERLVEQDIQFRSFMETVPGGFMVVIKGTKYRVAYIGENAAKLLKLGDEEIYTPDYDFFELVDENDHAKLRTILEKKSLLGTVVKERINLKQSDERYKPFELNLKCTRRLNGDRQYDIVIVPAPDKVEKEEILKRELAKYQKRSRLDSLTGVLDKEAFFAETLRIVQKNPDIDFIIGVWNIDRFKAVNELFGSKVGDSILCEFARMLEKRLENTISTFGRLESDHFAMCIPYDFWQSNEAKFDKLLNGEEGWNTLNYLIYLHIGLYKLEMRLPFGFKKD